MWKTNTFKAFGRMVKVGPTFDQLLSKYVKKRVGLNDRLAKRPHSPSRKRHVGSIESPKNNVQLIPNIPVWAPPPQYAHVPYHYAYPPPLYALNQMWGMPLYLYGMT
jgi:hypothetical protein